MTVGALVASLVSVGGGCVSSTKLEVGTGGAGGGGTSVSTYASTVTSVATGGDSVTTSATSTSATSTSSDTSGSSTSTGSSDPTPTGIALSGSTNTMQAGNTAGGGPSDDPCPVGQAIVGFSGALSSAGGYLGQIQGHCGTLALSASAPYAITVSAGDTLPEHGTFTASPWSALCPPNQIAVGFEGRSGSLVDQVALHCAPLVVSGPPFTVTVGPIDIIPPVGGMGGGPFSPIDCPAGQIATGAHLRSGDAIDAFGLTCSDIALTF